MQEILSLLDESNIINWEYLTDNQVVEIYKATTEEEKKQYEDTIQLFLDWWDPESLRPAVSYLFLENFVLKLNK